MDVLNAIVTVAALVFVVSSMLAMGLSLTVPQIMAPLRNARLVVLALAVNFVAVPFLAWAIQQVMDLDQSIYIGLLLIATAGGAPFQQAGPGGQGQRRPVGRPDGAVDGGDGRLHADRAAPVPERCHHQRLGHRQVADLRDARASRCRAVREGPLPGHRRRLQPHMAQTSSFAIIFMLVGAIILQWDDIVSLIGTGGIAAILIFLIVSFALGYFSGGSDPGTRSVLGLGTAQRNVSAALVVGAQNFADKPDVLVTVIVAALVGLVLLLPLAGELGRRSAGGASAA